MDDVLQGCRSAADVAIEMQAFILGDDRVETAAWAGGQFFGGQVFGDWDRKDSPGPPSWWPDLRRRGDRMRPMMDGVANYLGEPSPIAEASLRGLALTFDAVSRDAGEPSVSRELRRCVRSVELRSVAIPRAPVWSATRALGELTAAAADHVAYGPAALLEDWIAGCSGGDAKATADDETADAALVAGATKLIPAIAAMLDGLYADLRRARQTLAGRLASERLALLTRHARGELEPLAGLTLRLASEAVMGTADPPEGTAEELIVEAAAVDSRESRDSLITRCAAAGMAGKQIAALLRRECPKLAVSHSRVRDIIAKMKANG